MRLLSRKQLPPVQIGRLSNGSDKATVAGLWLYTIEEAPGNVYTVLDQSGTLTDAQILAIVPRPPTVQATTKADLEIILTIQYNEWLQWKTARLEAVARAVLAATITAMQTRENTAWATYLATVNLWRVAL